MTYTVRAKRWEDGWELHIGDAGVTQSNTLADAERMVRDYLRLDGHGDWKTADVDIVPELGGTEERVKVAKKKTAAAATLRPRPRERFGQWRGTYARRASR